MLTHSTVTGLAFGVPSVDLKEEEVTVPVLAVMAMVLAAGDVFHHHQGTKVLSMTMNMRAHPTKADHLTKVTTAAAATVPLAVLLHLTTKGVPEAHRHLTHLPLTTRLAALPHHHHSPRTLPRAHPHHQLQALNLMSPTTLATAAHPLITDAVEDSADVAVMVTVLTVMAQDMADLVTAAQASWAVLPLT